MDCKEKTKQQHSVRETPKGLIFPPHIAKKRGNKRTVATFVASGLFLFSGCAFTEGNPLLYLINTPCVMLSILGGVELINRICALVEEKGHMSSRYNSNIINLICDVFGFKLTSFLAIASSYFILLVTYFMTKKNPYVIMLNEGYISTTCGIISTLLLRDILKLEQSPLNVSQQIHELNGLDYGSGIAHSFFHGYLRIVLPHSGRQNDKGIKEFLQDYEARNDIKIDVYKLFILIPASQHCPPSLASDFSTSVEVSKELESKEVDRAGVKNRNYKNSVYKINIRGAKKYVAAEYATPVKTLHEVMRQNTPCSYLYTKHRADIILNFYLTLRTLLKDDPDCCDLCEPIYYNDKDEQGNYRDVGQIILSRMQDILRKTK